MSGRAPLWAIAAGAIDGVGDTHLPPGLHVRALPSPLLGLPATPLVISRTVLQRDIMRRLMRQDGVTWIDSRGVVQTPPFEVTPDNPVTGYLATSDVIFVELIGTAADAPLLPKVPVNPPNPAGPLAPVQSLQAVSKPGDALNKPGKSIPIKRKAVFGLEALAPTGLGLAPFQSRMRVPYQLAAWTISFVRVVGQGTVERLNWVAAPIPDGMAREREWTVWSLPVAPTQRYAATPDAAAAAKDRASRAAATRQPLYVAYNAPSPAASPAAGAGDALLRLDRVFPQLNGWMKAVTGELDVNSWEVVDSQTFTTAAGATGNAVVPVEPFLISAAVDPDVGHFIGFGDVDAQAEAQPGDVVLYRIRGAWRWIPDRWAKDPARASALKSGLRASRAALVKGFPALKLHDIVPQVDGAFLDLTATAVTIAGTPPAIPGVPNMAVPNDRGWLASPPPPAVRRAVGLRAENFLPHSVAALAATDADGLRTLHPFPGKGRMTPGQPPPKGPPLPLVVSRPAAATSPGQAGFEDRDVPEGAITYQLAQGDWFGRWGGWARAVAPAKERTKPARPTIEIFIRPPSFPSPVPDTPLSGAITLRIPIPRDSDLPPGGSALASLTLIETFPAAEVTTTYTLAALVGATVEPPTVAGGHQMLTIERAGPALARCASAKVSYTAQWTDILAHVSDKGDPAARTMVDPRPPPPPPVVTDLRYTARPDAEGHARADLGFVSVPGTRYRVFASTETTLLGALDVRGQSAAAAAIRAALPGAPRAVAFKQHMQLFDWGDFEGLTRTPLVATDIFTPFSHRLSASLEVLAFYRILAEGPSGQLSAMNEAELIPFAVPNLGPPARPQVAIVNAGLDPTKHGVKLRVRVPRGKAAARAWRLRRSSVPVGDPLAMNIVQSGLVTAAEPGPETTSFEIDAPEMLKPWRHYRFAVEVQADAPPGAPNTGTPAPPGEWSEASAPVAVAVVAPIGPDAPTLVAIQNVAGGLQVTVTCSDADVLLPGAMGPHRFDYWRVEPGLRPSTRILAFRRGPGQTWIALDDGPPAPAGTYVTVGIIDPIGRRGDAAISAVA